VNKSEFRDELTQVAQQEPTFVNADKAGERIAAALATSGDRRS
jgi:hypothetical protein